jgi:hypothetical protein
MCKELNEELERGNQLALALVDHLLDMGNAAACTLPVTDRAEEYIVRVMPKRMFYEDKQERDELLELAKHTFVAIPSIDRICAKCGHYLTHIAHR